VDDRKWLSPREFEDAIAACNLLPGPASTQLAIFCAWRVRGRVGALAGGGVHGHCGHRRTSTRSGCSDPQRWVTGEKQRGKGQDDDQPRENECKAAHNCAATSANPPGAIDRQLGGRRAREQVAGSNRVFELDRPDPSPALDTKLTQQLDMRGWPAEPDAADPPPLPQDRRHARP